MQEKTSREGENRPFKDGGKVQIRECKWELIGWKNYTAVKEKVRGRWSLHFLISSSSVGKQEMGLG